LCSTEKALVHISEADAINDFASVLARVRAGAEISIKSGHLVIAVIHPPAP
jgi:antitoxin (DNA-binding transcriptional repressor) of toxin-antitoxin stability system